MNKIVKNEVVKAVATMVHQMMAIAIVMGATYAIETVAAKQAVANETEVVAARKEAGRGQCGGGWHARNDAGRGQRGGYWRV